MKFSPLLVSNVIIKPLRYFFNHYVGENLKYEDDPKTSMIEIGSINDFHKIKIQAKPRILVNRGNFTVTHVGLTDNLAEAKTLLETKGLEDRTNMIFINGMATITVESRQEGVVELITDLVSHFLVWTKPGICNTQGFKNFAIPLSVSPVQVNKEDTEVFGVTISVPYTMEEDWNVKTQGTRINNCITSISAS